jgi:hypothetical protein
MILPVKATCTFIAELEDTVDGGRLVEVNIRHRRRRVVFLGTQDSGRGSIDQRHRGFTSSFLQTQEKE